MLDRLFKPAVPAPTPAPPAKPLVREQPQAEKPKPAQAARAPTPRATIPALPLPALGSKSYSSGEILAVDLRAGSLDKLVALGFSATPGSSLTNSRSTIVRLRIPVGMDALDAQKMLREQLPADQFALNRVYRIYRVANDGAARPAQRTAPASQLGSGEACKGDRCAGREMIGWKEHLRACSAGLRVGVIDTDVDYRHPAFSDTRLKLGSFIPEGRVSAPDWHGTGVLGLLAGHPQGGTPGLIPRAEFFVANVFFADGSGGYATDTVSLLKALDWISAFDVKLVNMSFAGPKDDLVQKSIASMSAKGVVFVAAAGNEGPSAEPSYPAAYKQVVAVTAVTKDMRNFPYANRGEHIDVAAPGVDVWTAVSEAKEGYQSGTSFAAPYVTAALATIYATAPRRGKDDLLARLDVRDLGPPGRDPIYGRGLLVAPAACQPEMVNRGSPPASAAAAAASPSTRPQPTVIRASDSRARPAASIASSK